MAEHAEKGRTEPRQVGPYLALPRKPLHHHGHVLERLDPGTDALIPTGDGIDRSLPYVPPGLLDGPRGAWREIARDEKELFHATNQLRAARVFVRASSPQETDKLVERSAAATDEATTPKLAPGTEAALVLSLPHPMSMMLELEPEEQQTPYLTRTFWTDHPLGWRAGGDEGTTYVHQTSEVFTTLVRSNFRVDALLELGPTGDRTSIHSSALAEWVPSTLIVRGRKEGS